MCWSDINGDKIKQLANPVNLHHHMFTYHTTNQTHKQSKKSLQMSMQHT